VWIFTTMLGCLRSTLLLLLAVATAAFRPQWRAPAVRHSAPPTPRAAVDLGLVLTEENARQVLDECEQELATVFGVNADALKVGITGRVEFVELEGPTLVVRLTGRFWHARADVLARVESYVVERIPECIGLDIEDEEQLDDQDAPPIPSRD
jgi:hypothetical protein